MLLDYEMGQLALSGQHEEVIVVRADGSLEQIDMIDLGFPIALEDISPIINQAKISLGRGDMVVLHTDGITEAIDENCT
jgi:serine phosphatase RsbU (regulator of sigma subunit)